MKVLPLQRKKIINTIETWRIQSYVIVFLSVDLFSGLALFNTLRKSEVLALILL